MATLSLAGLESLLSTIGLKTPIPEFSEANVLTDPLDISRIYLADAVHAIVQGSREVAYHAVQLPATVDGLNGDLSIILPKLARESGTDMEDLRKMILDNFPKHPLFQPPISDGKQLRIFCLSKPLAQFLLPFIEDRNTQYGTPLIQPGTPAPKVLLEFSSPNVVTEMNGKHFRSTLLGAQLANIYQAHGWEVVKMNYLGDWGKPIGLLGVGFSRFGSEELLQSDTVNHLRDVYRRILELFSPELAASKKVRDNQNAGKDTGESNEIQSKGLFAERNAYFSRLENGEEKAVALWKQLRDASIADYIKTYARLNVEFDIYSGESQISPETMNEVEKALKEKGICEEREGSTVINLQDHGSKHGTATIRDKAGSTYLLRELAAIIERHRLYNFDRMDYVVANDQHSTHFHRLKDILELLDMKDLASKFNHVSFNEAFHLPESSDTLLTTHKILDKCEEAIRISLLAHPKHAALLSTDASTVGGLSSSAWFAQASSVKRNAELKPNVDKMSSFEQGSSLYFSSWMARLSHVQNDQPETLAADTESDAFLSNYDYAILLRWLAHYPEVVRSSFRAAEPTIIMAYLGTITSQLEECLDEEGEEGEWEGDGSITVKSSAHVKFLNSVRVVLSNGTNLLGFTKNRSRDSGIFI